MTTRRLLVWLPWALFVLACVIAAMELVVSLQNTEATNHRIGLVDWLVGIEVFLPPLTFTAVGAFIVMRRPGNRIGWVMLVIGLGFAFGSFTSDYPGFSAHTHRPTRPFGTAIAWIGTWSWSFYLSALLLLALLFPTGELPSRKWKPVMWAGLTGLSAASVLGAVQRGPIDGTPIDNPYGLISIPEGIYSALLLCGLIAMAAAVLSLILRFRTARGEMRQQLKWFLYGATLAITFVIVAFATSWSSVLALFAVAALSALPLFIGIAILRYRLYDIDVLISRTLVYGTLSATLALVYGTQTLLLQGVFRLLTGQQSEVTVAVSTLAIAAVFQPLRRRVQSTIDRRFYRRKYDATRAITAFQSQLRDEVDLERLTADLVQVVHDTVQPVMVSIWLREGGSPMHAARGERSVGQVQTTSIRLRAP